MNVDQLISKARSALTTGQPNLAALYMRNALQQTDQKRRELNPIGWQARQLTKVFQSIGDEITKVGKQWADIFESFAKAFATETGINRKTNYVLVADNPNA